MTLGKGPCLRQPRSGGLERLVVGHRPLFILIEFAVAEELPPGVFGKRIERSSPAATARATARSAESATSGFLYFGPPAKAATLAQKIAAIRKAQLHECLPSFATCDRSVLLPVNHSG